MEKVCERPGIHEKSNSIKGERKKNKNDRLRGLEVASSKSKLHPSYGQAACFLLIVEKKISHNTYAHARVTCHTARNALKLG